jgi:hypothetical protein
MRRVWRVLTYFTGGGVKYLSANWRKAGMEAG